MKIFRIKCDKCGQEVELNKARQLTIDLQKRGGEVLTCAPIAMQQMNANIYAPTTIDLCTDCVKEILDKIPAMKDYANRL